MRERVNSALGQKRASEQLQEPTRGQVSGLFLASISMSESKCLKKCEKDALIVNCTYVYGT